MKKLMIIFMGVGMALVSCKSHVDGLASNVSDDVYYNPAKERKVNVPPPVQQYESQQQYNPNQGKIAATEADKNNPYYKDPNFNYDDYYDNAYAARVKRFQQPLYGTGYYDSYYTNQYNYTGIPSQYGNSIYNTYPSYGYNSYGNGMGYGSGLSMSMGYGYGNGYGMGYNPYGMGYGCGNGMGYGYNPYGMSGYGMGYGSGMGYGYNPYGMSGYGMGYGSGMGYGYNPYGMGGYGMGNGYYNSPMYSSAGYFNSYDYNSGTYHYGPRGTHAGGNSTTTSPTPHNHRIAETTPAIEGPPSAAPFSSERFNQVSIPKENFVKIVEAKNPVNNNNQYQQFGGGGMNMQPNEGRPTNVNANEGRPIYNNTNNGFTKGGFSNSNSYGGGTQDGNYSAPRTIHNQNTVEPQADPKPHKWFSGTNFGSDNGSNNNGNTPSYSRPTGGSWGGGGSSGGSSGGGGGGGGASHPRR